MTTSLPARVRAAATPERTVATVALGVVVASVLAVASLLDGIGESGDLAVLDRPTLAWLVDHREPVLTTLMTAVSTVGGEVVLTALAVVTVAALAWRRRFDEALLLGLALGAAEALSLVLKHAVGRSRPPVGDVVGPVETTLSFPSGHTIGTATFALVLAYLGWRRSPGVRRAVGGLVGAGGATVLMASSRLYLGDHWLTDVLGSIALATGMLALVVLADLRLRRRGPAWVRASASVRLTGRAG